MSVVIYRKGSVLKQFIGSPSSMMFDNIDGVAYLFVHVSPDWLGKMKLGGQYDFACGQIEDTIFICAKWGGNAWSSMPYSPHLANGEFPEVYESGFGMPLNVILVNTQNGEIVDMDLMSLSNEFSNSLSRISKELRAKEFNRSKHISTINKVYEQYATDNELVEVLPYKCHVD